MLRRISVGVQLGFENEKKINGCKLGLAWLGLAWMKKKELGFHLGMTSVI